MGWAAANESEGPPSKLLFGGVAFDDGDGDAGEGGEGGEETTVEIGSTHARCHSKRPSADGSHSLTPQPFWGVVRRSVLPSTDKAARAEEERRRPLPNCLTGTASAAADVALHDARSGGGDS